MIPDFKFQISDLIRDLESEIWNLKSKPTFPDPQPQQKAG